MPRNTLLFSHGLSALPDVLDELPASLQLMYVPTAANGEDDPSFAKAYYEALAEMGFHIDEVDLDTASPDRVQQATAAADLIYVGGGNTYYLLDRINRSGFRDALAANPDTLYTGGSAGAIVACQDIAFIDDIDDPEAAPELESTTGLGLVDFLFLPHTDHPAFADAVADVQAGLPAGSNPIAIRDDQAVYVRNGQPQVIDSPATS